MNNINLLNKSTKIFGFIKNNVDKSEIINTEHIENEFNELYILIQQHNEIIKTNKLLIENNLIIFNKNLKNYINSSNQNIYLNNTSYEPLL
jgi:hypothetical protein